MILLFTAGRLVLDDTSPACWLKRFTEDDEDTRSFVDLLVDTGVTATQEALDAFQSLVGLGSHDIQARMNALSAEALCQVANIADYLAEDKVLNVVCARIKEVTEFVDAPSTKFGGFKYSHDISDMVIAMCGDAEVTQDGRVACNLWPSDVIFWNVDECKYTGDLQEPGRVHKMVIMPDGQLATATAGGEVNLWNLETGECTCRMTTRLADDEVCDVTSCLVLQDGRIVTAYNTDHDTLCGTVALWSPQTLVVEHLFHLPTGISSMVALEDDMLCLGDYEGGMHILHAKSGAVVITFNTDMGSVSCLASLPGRRICIGYIGRGMAMFERDTAKLTKIRDGDREDDSLKLAALPGFQLAIWSLGWCGDVEIYDMFTMSCVHKFRCLDRLLQVVSLPDGNLVTLEWPLEIGCGVLRLYKRKPHPEHLANFFKSVGLNQGLVVQLSNHIND